MLDEEEKDILESYERGEWKPIRNPKAELKNFESMQGIHCKRTRE